MLALIAICLVPIAGAQTTRGAKLDSDRPPAAPANSKYYALVIGIDQYQHFPPLKTAVNDAQSIAHVLTTRYGFKVKLLVDADATRDNIIDALDYYVTNLEQTDNFLLYYAGHGQRKGDDGYWFPVDARTDSTSRWISAEDVTTKMRNLNSRHALIVADSCYSGDLANPHRGVELNFRPSDMEVFLRKSFASHSRTLMASGGDEPVSDIGPNNHSVFANAVLNALEKMDAQAITGGDLFSYYVVHQVSGQSKQQPHYLPIPNSSDDGDGDFVFIRGGISADTALQHGPTPPPLAAAQLSPGAPRQTQPSGTSPAQSNPNSDMELYQKALASHDPAEIDAVADKMSNQTLANVLHMRATSLRTLEANASAARTNNGTTRVPASRAKAQLEYTKVDADSYAHRGNYLKAFPLYKQAAEAGDSESMASLGFCYYNGWGVPQDYAEAAKWFQKAADEGESKVFSSLGLMYAMGRGVPQNDQLSLDWNRKAAAAGDPIGMLGLGSFYAAGRGVPKDLNEAANWYRKSAALGNEGAKQALRKMGLQQ